MSVSPSENGNKEIISLCWKVFLKKILLKYNNPSLWVIIWVNLNLALKY